VEQWRHPVGERFWELPQGALDGEGAAEPEHIARTELAEETGLRAESMRRLGRLYFAYGISNQPVDVWRATGLEPGPQALESTEAGLVVARFTVATVEEMIRSNEIQDAASVAAWHLCGASASPANVNGGR